MFHKVRAVYPQGGFVLLIEFAEGVAKLYDVAALFEKIPAFACFKGRSEEFGDVRVDVGGYGIVWNDELDVSCDELWENGQEVETAFDGLMALSDATALWNLSESTLRKAISYGRLRRGIDVSKFGKQWVVSAEAMFALYGKPVVEYDSSRLYQARIVEGAEPTIELEFMSGERRHLYVLRDCAGLARECRADPGYLGLMSLRPHGEGLSWPQGPTFDAQELYELSVPA